MAAYDITLHGCDDSTTVTVDVVSEHEVTLLEYVAHLTQQASGFDCQPKMTVTPHTETTDD